MKMNKTNFIVTTCVALLFIALAVNTAFAAFQEQGWGARPMGLGGAFTAVDEDVNGILYNPALIADLQDPELTFMYGKLYTGLDEVDMGLNYFALGVPLNNKIGTIGFSWTNFVSANLYDESSFALNYSKVLGAGFSGGVNFKYLSHKYTLDTRTINDPVFASGNSKSALTFDVGTLYRPKVFDERFALGLSFENATQPDLGLASKDIVPAQLRLGSAYNFTEDILAALDLSYRMQDWGTDSDKYDAHLGGEFWFFEHVLGLRAGANTTEVAVGFGINPTLNNLDLQLDYSFIMPLVIQESMGTHRISLTLRFFNPNYVPEQKKYTQEVKQEKPKVVVEEEKITPKAEPAPMPKSEPKIEMVIAEPMPKVVRTPVVSEPNVQEPTVIFAEAKKQGMDVKADGDKIIITENINFESGEAKVLQSEKLKIAKVVKLMNIYTDYKVTIIGHTDSSGGVKANLDLSEYRAQAVLEQMISMGISEGRLSSLGMGGSSPIADNTTVEGKAKNRRVEFVLEKQEQ